MPNSFIRAFRAFDIFRLRGVLLVVTGGIAIFAGMHWVLSRTLGQDAAAVYPRQRLLGWPLHERTWRRVAAIDRMYKHNQFPPGTRLGVFMGVSTTAAGIERLYLDAKATAADRWIILSGAGLSFENMESVTHPLFFCTMKPTTVVFGIHPQMLVGERFIGDEPTIGAQPVVGRRNRGRKAFLSELPVYRWLNQHFAVRHRLLMENFLRTQIYTARLWVFYLAGVSADGLFAPAPEPWDEDPLWLWNMDDSEDRFASGQRNFWSSRGHFNAENYHPDGPQAQALVRMIKGYRSLGAKVFLVLMPLRTTTRDIVPSIAKPCFYEALRLAFPDSPPKVIDLEDAIPDRLFTDEAHLTKNGADRLSKLVAERLQTRDGL